MKSISLIGFLIFSLVLLTPSLVFSQEDIVSSGDAFFVEIVGSEKKPVFFVGDDFLINVSGGDAFELSGRFVGEVKQEIFQEFSSKFKVSNVEFIRKEDIFQITVLGDISMPGNYWLAKGANLEAINDYNVLFDSDKYDSSMTLIRRGKRTVISSKEYPDYKGKKDDVYLVSLTRKPEPVVLEVDKQSDLSVDNILGQATEKPAGNPSKSSSEKSGNVDEEPDPEPEPSIDLESDKEKIKKILKNYELQPGDILAIGLPGEAGFNKNFLIDREGVITLPEVGQLKVSGLPMSQVEDVIFSRLSEVFLGLDKLTIHLKEKRLLITVLGYVTKPGEVDIPSNGNVQTAINIAGGLVAGAQINKIQLQRNGEMQEFNFKKYLDSGDRSLIPKLQSLDVLFVPSSPELGNVHGDMDSSDDMSDLAEARDTIKVFGEVAKASSLPYQEGMSLIDALLRSGGVTRYANVEQIRIIDKGEPSLFNLKGFLDNGDESALVALSKGATIFVPTQVEAVQGGGRIVYVMGQVQKPGSFETGNNVSFLDVLASAGGPNRYADTRMVRILRSNGEVEPFNLQEYAEGSGDKLPVIVPGDAIFIPEKSVEEDQSWLKLATDESIQLLGAIKKPGRYVWSDKITFMDLLGHAGGPSAQADTSNIKIITSDENGKAITSIFNMEEFVESGGSWSQVPQLQGGSVILIPERAQDPNDNKAQWLQLPKEQAIYLMGAVKNPGRFAFNNKLDLLDIITAANGPDKDADLSRVRIVHRGEGKPRVSVVNLLDYFETGDESLLVKVQVGDSIYVPSTERGWTEKKTEDTVRVLGAVTTSGRYDFINEMTILDLLAEAGGPTTTAYVEKIIIVNTSCCKNQAYTFDLMDFMKDPDASYLPVLRAGDTVYVPDTTMSYWSIFMDAVKDSLSVLSLITIIKGF